MRVGPSVNEVQLVDLIPNTEYTLTAYVSFGDITSDPLTTQEVTCMGISIFVFSLLIQQHLTFILFHATVVTYLVLFRRQSSSCLMHFLTHKFQTILKRISFKRVQVLEEEQKVFFLE